VDRGIAVPFRGLVWSASQSGRFTLRKDSVPIVQEVGWAQGRSGRMRKISPPPEFDPQTVQPVASRYRVEVELSIIQDRTGP
jgi:hypothetical protein